MSLASIISSRRRRAIAARAGAGGATVLSPSNSPNRLLWLDASSGVNARGAASFPGSTSHYLTRAEADSRTLSPGNVDFWLAGWVRRNELLGYQGVAARYGTGTNNHREWLLQFREDLGGSAAWTVSANGSTFTRVDFGTIPTINQWNFYFAYYDAANAQISLRMNDLAWATPVAHAGGIATNLAPLTVGCWINSGVANSPLNGSIDQLCFGKSPAGGIASARDTISASLYNAGSGLGYSDLSVAQKTDWGLVSFWEMDERTGTRVDSHGPNSLSMVGTVPGIDGKVEGPADDLDPVATWDDKIAAHEFANATIANRPTWRSVGYVDFDGTDDQLSFGSTGGLVGNQSTFTLLARVRLDALPATNPAVIFEEADAGGNVVNRLAVNASGNVVASYRPSGGTLVSATSTGTLATATDYVLGVRRNGTSLQVFIDGTPSGSAATIDAGTTLTGAIPRVGGPVVSTGFASLDGRVLDVWASSEAFTDEQIATLSGGF